MTACVALTGCYVKRGLSPVSKIERRVLVNACESLGKGCPHAVAGTEVETSRSS